MKIFITDSSAPSFFTSVFDAFNIKECVITSDENVQLAFDSEVVRVGYDAEKCERVRSGIAKYDKYAEDEILLALRSCDPLKEQIAFEYIKTLMKNRAPIRKMMSLPEVIEFDDIIHKVTGEAHKLKGFLRFMESKDKVLYAPYSPDNNITDILMEHFAERLKSERFVIHDVKRKIAGMYNGKEWIMNYVGEAEIYLSEYERAFESLWKKYYVAVNIKERPHEKQMKGYMPVRYWKFLPEKKQ
ncbi:MAG: TIGR03915 family putative DNA repair protein [Clostridia bacterium]|nr:TIGR03915 family putative DNA repair protein [Clostridia bacterium]